MRYRERERERETLFEKARERKETKYGELVSAAETAGYNTPS